MAVQIIEREGKPEYAVLPWDEYQALLAAAGIKLAAQVAEKAAPAAEAPVFSLQQVAARREACGLTQQQLAREVGISPHYMAMIESGERQPEGAIVSALQRAFERLEKPA